MKNLLDHVYEWKNVYVPSVIVLISFVVVAFTLPSDTIKGKDVSGADGRGEVKLVVLDDGTKCAVLIGYAKGAITCNWK